MSENSKISWTDSTFNPWWGCQKVSPACEHCYAETLAKRTGFGRAWSGQYRRFDQKHFNEPLRWNQKAEKAGVKRRVFTGSMCDILDSFETIKDPDLHERLVTDRRLTFQIIEKTPFLEWLLLTKRPENIQDCLPSRWIISPPENVRLGITVENQEMADKRITILLNSWSGKNFISVEPMLSAVNLTKVKWAKIPIDPKNYVFGAPPPDEMWSLRNALQSRPGDEFNKPLIGIQWVICGGESGTMARPMHPDWVRDLRDQCVNADVPFFFKQWGEWAPDCLCDTKKPHPTVDRPKPGYNGCMFRCGANNAGRLLDGREWNEFPLEKI